MDVSALDYQMQTPLHVAAANHNPAAVLAMIQGLADPNLVDYKGR